MGVWRFLKSIPKLMLYCSISLKFRKKTQLELIINFLLYLVCGSDFSPHHHHHSNQYTGASPTEATTTPVSLPQPKPLHLHQHNHHNQSHNSIALTSTITVPLHTTSTAAATTPTPPPLLSPLFNLHYRNLSTTNTTTLILLYNN